MATIASQLHSLVSLAGRALRVTVQQPKRALLVARMANWTTVLVLLVKFMPLNRALGYVSPRTIRSGPAQRGNHSDLASAIDALLATEILFFRPSCWKRAAILHRYLALQGVESQIKFGMRKDPDGKLSGHAWLEQDGQPLLESSHPDYVVTYSFPSTTPVQSFAFPLEI